MSNFEMYVDESESATPSLLLAGGWTSEAERWAKFSERWRAALIKYRVDYFHSHSFKNARHPKYRHLNKFERDELLIRLLGLIRDHAEFGRVAWVKPAIYDRLTTKQFRSRHGSAYATVVGQAMACASLSIWRYLPGECSLSFFLEGGNHHATEALQYIERFKTITSTLPADVEIIGPIGNSGLRFLPVKTGTLGSGSKWDLMPLQAADILAYCSLCVIRNPKDGFARAALAGIDRPVQNTFIDEEAILQMMERLKQTDEMERLILLKRSVQKKQLIGLGVHFTELPDGLLVELPDDDKALAEEVKEILWH